MHVVTPDPGFHSYLISHAMQTGINRQQLQANRFSLEAVHLKRLAAFWLLIKEFDLSTFINSI